MRRKPEAFCTTVLIVINVAVFLILSMLGDTEDAAFMLQHGAMYEPFITEGQEYYRIFTCMFLHFGISHLANNMLVLFVLGQRLEPVVGKIKFILIYLLGGLGGNVISLLADVKKNEYAVSAGASGAVFAVMGAMIYVVIWSHGQLQDISTRQILIMAAFSLYFGFTSTGVDNAAHVGGMIMGFLLAVLLYHPSSQKKLYNCLML